MAAFDVLIAGAGPAGSAAAIMLARSAPGLRVALAAPSSDRRAPIGEVLSPLARPVLRELGLWQPFLAQGHPPAQRSFSAWGGPGLMCSESLLGARGPSWRIDRLRFDRWMAQEAGRAATRIDACVTGLDRGARTWSVACGAAEEHTARFVIDATGRRGILARGGRGGERSPEALDRLVAAYVVGTDPTGGVPDLIVEACLDGWWYTVALGEGRRSAVCMTDADIAHRLKLGTIEGWRAALDQTRFVAPVVRRADMGDPPRLLPAGGRYRAPAGSADILRAGDAAAAFDPISGQGVVRAMRSGIFAAYAAGDRLLREDAAVTMRYGNWLAREVDSYAAGLREHYAAERRWAECPFWRRRQSVVQ